MSDDVVLELRTAFTPPLAHCPVCDHIVACVLELAAAGWPAVELAELPVVADDRPGPWRVMPCCHDVTAVVVRR